MAKTIKILNLYSGIGGNRKLWPSNIEVTAVEINKEIASIYQKFFPNDKVIVADAHQYLLDHYKEFDFIWASPPCPTHSRMTYMTAMSENEKNSHESFRPRYPDMNLYQEIIFLKTYFKGKWVVENVISYYEPLIRPFTYESHYYWANFIIDGKKVGFRCHDGTLKKIQDLKGFDISKYKLTTVRKDQVLRNCVEPRAGFNIFNSAFKIKQTKLG